MIGTNFSQRLLTAIWKFSVDHHLNHMCKRQDL